MAIISLQNALNLATTELGLQEKILENQISKIWLENYGDNLAKISKFQKGTLHLLTTSTTWRYELELRKDSILEDINSKLKKPAISRIVIK